MLVAPSLSVVQHFRLPLNESQVETWASEQRSILAGPVAFGLLFCAPDVVVHASEIQEIVRIYAQTSVVLGCSTDGFIAESEEREGGEGFCIALYHLPGTKAHSVHLEGDVTIEPLNSRFVTRLQHP